MRTISLSALLVALLLSSGPGPAIAEEEQWAELEARSRYVCEDLIVLAVSEWPGAVERLRLNVSGRPLHVVSVTLHFEGGGARSVVLRRTIASDGSYEFALASGDSEVVAISVRIKLRSSQSNRADVRVSGRLVSGSEV